MASPPCPQPLPRIPVTKDIIPTALRLSAEKWSLVDNLIKTIDPAEAFFDNVARPLADLENKHADEDAIIYALRYAAPEKETQHAVEEADRIWRETDSKINKRADCYRLLKAVRDRAEPLDYESQKYLDRKLLAYTQCGHGSLGEADIHKWLATSSKIQELCAEFNKNMREYDGGIWLTAEELEGVPQHDLEAFEKGEDGKCFVSLKGRNGLNVLKHAHSAQTRKHVLEAEGTKLPENVPLFRQVVLLRDTNARLLGLKSHATYKLPYRLAESTEWIDDLLQKLAQGLLPHGQKCIKDLEKMKQTHLSGNAPHLADNSSETSLCPWDIAYYQRMAEESEAVDHEKISEYFPLRHTVGIMLQLFADYFQLRFDPIPPSDTVGSVWAEDVEVWSVWDQHPEADDGFVGYLYADLLERPNKYRHNQCVNLQPGYIRPDGSRVYPATTLMCYFPRPTATTLPCLKHRDVVTLFHELGHGMHDLLARTKYRRFHGYAVCLEFGEAIGMMLENWCWMPEQLKAMSLHCTRIDPQYGEAWKRENVGASLPPETIPDAYLENLVKRRSVERLGMSLRQLSDSSFDMAVHSPPSHGHLLTLNETELYKDLCEHFEGWRHPESSHIHIRLGHLLSGYDAGYYSYLCANVIAAEFFQEIFAEDCRSQEAWNRFRRRILQYGGSRSEREVLEELLGHPISPNSFLKSLALPPIL